MDIRVASDASVLVVFGDKPDLETHQRVVRLTNAVLRLQDLRIRNIHPAYTSVLIDFDPLRMRHEDVAEIVAGVELDTASSATGNRVVEIPVCYGAEFGIDLEDVARELTTSPDEVVRRHTAGEYFVSFFGFSPGFAYLGGLAENLHVARLQSPRKLVKAGSVAIAGAQTGVYPVDSPGGWRVLGRTPLRMFDATAEHPSPLEIGDRVRFAEISRDDFDRRIREVAQ